MHYTGFSQFIPLVSLATVENATLHPLDICYHSEHIIGLKQLLILSCLPIADSVTFWKSKNTWLWDVTHLSLRLTYYLHKLLFVKVCNLSKQFHDIRHKGRMFKVMISQDCNPIFCSIQGLIWLDEATHFMKGSLLYWNFTDLTVNIIQKHSHRNFQNSFVQISGPCPVKVIHKINHHTYKTITKLLVLCIIREWYVKLLNTDTDSPSSQHC